MAAIAMGEQGQEDCPTGWRGGRARGIRLSACGRAAVVGVGTDLVGQRRGELAGPAAMLGQERLGIVIGMVMQVKSRLLANCA